MFASTRSAGALAAVAATAVVAIGVAGCTGGGSTSAAAPANPTTAASSASSPAASNAATPTASSVASPKVTAAASTPAASSPAASSSPPSTGTPACPTKYLSAKAGLSQGTAGSIYQVIDFTNISNAPCTLFGYPGVSLASGTPVTQVGAAASRTTTTAATVVTLAPGQTASALLRIVEAGNYSPGTCSPTTTTYIQIYPPNQTTPIYLGYKSTGCASSSVKLLSVSVVTPGSGG